MKKILIINTGGTFSSVKTEEGLAPGLVLREILSDSKISESSGLAFEEFCSVDSSNICPEDWALLAKRISEIYRVYRGIIVIHGTDTLAYTSSMLTYMLKGIPIPVVFTGSQLPASDAGSDAFKNLSDAVLMAKSGYPGIFVCFGGRIILGDRASKVRSKSCDAFESINYPYIGEVIHGKITVKPELIPQNDGKFEPRFDFCDKVFLLKLYPGISPKIIDRLVEAGYLGIVTEGFGVGNIPNLSSEGQGSLNFTDALKKAAENGLTVIATTQCTYGGSDLSVYETGKKALSAGVICAGDMTSEAAVTKLMWTLGQDDPAF